MPRSINAADTKTKVNLNLIHDIHMKHVYVICIVCFFCLEFLVYDLVTHGIINIMLCDHSTLNIVLNLTILLCTTSSVCSYIYVLITMTNK